MGSLGPGELGIILVIVLVLFGGAQLPKLARSLGQAQRELRQGMAEGYRDDETTTDEAPRQDPPAAPQ